MLDTLRRISEMAADRIHENLAGEQNTMNVTGTEDPEAEDEGKVVREHLERIRKVRPMEEAHVAELHAAGQVNPDDVNAFLRQHVDRSEEVTPPVGLYVPEDEAPAPPAVIAPQEMPRWVTGLTAAMIFGGTGVVIGIGIGWLAFHP